MLPQRVGNVPSLWQMALSSLLIPTVPCKLKIAKMFDKCGYYVERLILMYDLTRISLLSPAQITTVSESSAPGLRCGQVDYVLADIWFSAQENLAFVRHDLGKHFVVALKSNRTVALTLEDKKEGRFVQIDQLS